MNSSRFSLCRPAVGASLEASLTRLDASPAFERAALAICDQVHPTGEAASVIGDLARRILSRVPSKHDKALLAHAHALLFEEVGLRLGDEDLGGLVLVKILASGRGAALSLALIYKLVLARLGIRSTGIALPGRLLVSVEIDDGSMLVDVAAGGRVISLDEALVWSRRVAATTGPARDPLPVLSHAFWLCELARRLADSLKAQGRAADAEVLTQISSGLRSARSVGIDPSPNRERFPAEGGASESNPGGTDNIEMDNLEEGV